MAAAGAGVFVTGNGEFLFYFAVMMVLIAIAAVVHFRVGLSLLALWGLSFWGAAHMAGGLLPVPDHWPIQGDIRVLYSWWIWPKVLKYDQLVHAYGFAVMTLVCWEALRKMIAAYGGEAREIRPTAGALVLCVMAAQGFGALNEMIEFAATMLVPETNVGGYVNTSLDLVANLVGSLMAAGAIYLRGRDSARSTRN